MKRRRGEGERKAKFFLKSEIPKVSTFFRVTPNVAVGTQKHQEPETLVSSTAASVSWGGDEVEGDTSDAFHHKNVSTKAVEMLNYIKYW